MNLVGLPVVYQGQGDRSSLSQEQAITECTICMELWLCVPVWRWPVLPSLSVMLWSVKYARYTLEITYVLYML